MHNFYTVFLKTLRARRFHLHVSITVLGRILFYWLQIHTWAISRESLTIEKTGVVRFGNDVLNIVPHPSLRAIGVILRGNTVLLRNLGKTAKDELNIKVQDSNVTALTLTEHQLIYGTDRGKIYVWNYGVRLILSLLISMVGPMQG